MGWTTPQESTKEEIEARLKNMGDMLKIEYLENCLKKNLAFDVRRFVHLKLAEIYQQRAMKDMAAKNFDAVAELATTYKDKMNAYMQETKLLVEHGDYIKAENAFKKALVCGNTREKEEMKIQFKNMLMKKAESLEEEKKFNNASKVYEFILRLVFLSESEKIEIKDKLRTIYERLGKIRELAALK